MKNVTKERDFIYRLPFACVCMLINKDTLINEDVLILNEDTLMLNEDTFKHMHRTSRHKSVLTTLQHLLHLYNTISTSTTSGKSDFCLLRLRQAYCDLAMFLSTVKQNVTKHNCA